MIRIGILGDIGSGKSFVAKKFGFPVFNADLEVSKLYNKNTISHSRNSQIANVMTQRLRVIDLDDKRTKLSKKYFEFLKKRTKIKDDVNRKKLKFKI